MDREAFDRIFQAQAEELCHFIQQDTALPVPEVLGRKVLVFVDGIRNGGEKDRYRLVLDGSGFPLHPYDAGFVNPALSAPEAADADLKNPQWYPRDGEQALKSRFRGQIEGPAVFICIQPGFSREYFHYHRDQTWNPRVWSLAQIVEQVRQALNAPTYVPIGYKGKDGHHKRCELRDAIALKTQPWLNISSHARELCSVSDHGFDTLVAALVCQAHTRGHVELFPGT